MSPTVDIYGSKNLAGSVSGSGKLSGNMDGNGKLYGNMGVKYGADGVSPLVDVEETEKAVTITVTDIRGTKTTSIPKERTSVPRIGAVTLTADRWEGSGNLFSQVVSIDGVTEYSQVDLTPSIEQLAVFYEKDLAFVTENEDGVVTVYCIGQKPQSDYTIQVTITEVDYE